MDPSNAGWACCVEMSRRGEIKVFGTIREEWPLREGEGGIHVERTCIRQPSPPRAKEAE